MQIFEPYFISNTTILQYENQDVNKKLSLLEIITTYHQANKLQTKLFFKVQKEDIKRSSSWSDNTSNSEQEDNEATTLDQFYDDKN
jgi:hypothetical protein